MTDEVAKPQVSVIGPDTFTEAEEEEPVTAMEQSVTAANEEEPHCQVQSEKWVIILYDYILFSLLHVKLKWWSLNGNNE